MKKTYDLLCFIGRFQPFHNGHAEVIDRALKLAKNVLVIVGSANQARSLRNPFTLEERKSLISKIYPTVHLRGVADFDYNDTAWVTTVTKIVNETKAQLDAESVGLIGCNKDHTSYYLKLFPDWANESVAFLNPLNATAIRNRLYTDSIMHEWEEASVMPRETYSFLRSMQDAIKPLKQRYSFIQEYKAKYGSGPFITADALVQVGGKVLLIRRGKEYGHGLYALPGGFVENETFEQAALRELKEETNLRVPTRVLKGSIINSKIFDAPGRSERGRLVTQCFHILLANDTALPEVRGSSDADEAGFIDTAWIVDNEHLFFEDHHAIIMNMLGLTKKGAF